MWLSIRNPLFQNSSVFVDHLKLCPFQFFPCANVCFGNFHFGIFVFHFNLCHTSIFFDFKGHIAGRHIAVFIRSQFFMQSISSFRQTINHMIFFGTGPFFHDISVFVDHLQFCSFQLISGCCICFGNTCFCRLILNFFVQFNLCKILIFIGCVYIPYFLIWKISGFSDFLFDIVFSMWKITVESKCSLCICCFLFQQGIFLYENLSLIRKNIFRSIQSKNNTFQLFACDRIFLFY